MNFEINTAIAYTLGTDSVNQRYTYQRKEYPQLTNLEEKLVKIYKAKKVLIVNSGMEAITTLFDYYLENNDTILINRNLYAEAQLWLKAINRYEVIMCDFKNIKETKSIIKSKKPKLIHFDNPTMRQEWINAKEIIKTAHKNGTKVSIDNSIVSFNYYNPINDDADFITESYSKYICGHGDTMAGALIFKDDPKPKNGFSTTDFFEWRGRCVNPMQVYNIERGLETLKIRMEKSTDTAQKAANWLKKESIPYMYAGIGGNIVIPNEKPLEIMEKLRETGLFTPLSAYGATFSICTPSRRADSYQDDMSYIRLSFGMEDYKTLIQALKTVFKEN